MPKTRPAYPEQFRREALELVRRGRSIPDVAERLGVSPQTLRNWRPTAPTASTQARPPAGDSNVGRRHVRGRQEAAPGPPRGGTGQRGEQLLALDRESPGVTVAEAGKALGVDPTGLYRGREPTRGARRAAQERPESSSRRAPAPRARRSADVSRAASVSASRVARALFRFGVVLGFVVGGRAKPRALACLARRRPDRAPRRFIAPVFNGSGRRPASRRLGWR
jgi:transposase-like protein